MNINLEPIGDAIKLCAVLAFLLLVPSHCFNNDSSLEKRVKALEKTVEGKND